MIANVWGLAVVIGVGLVGAALMSFGFLLLLNLFLNRDLRGKGKNNSSRAASSTLNIDGKHRRLEVILIYRHGTEVCSLNITHSLAVMADEAGIYQCLWVPCQARILFAAQLILPLSEGLALLLSDPDRFKKFNPENGWGSYDTLVEFVQQYLDACKKNPRAIVQVYR